MHLDVYIGLLLHTEQDLAASFDEVARHHGHEPDIAWICSYSAGQCQARAEALNRCAGKYGSEGGREPDKMRSELFRGPRSGGLGLLRDLQDLFLLGSMAKITWEAVHQAALALRDQDLIRVAERGMAECGGQLNWIETRMKTAAPQALVVA